MLLWIDKALSLTEGYGTAECKPFRERIFSAHPTLALPLAKQYVRTAKAHDYPKANDELRRHHQKLILGNSFEGLFIDSPDSDIKRFAKQRSVQVQGLSERLAKKIGFRQMAKKIASFVAQHGFQLPVEDLDNTTDEQVAGAIARAFDPKWWKRKIKDHQYLALESVCIGLGLVNRQQGIYASDLVVRRKLEDHQQTQAMLAGLEAVNDLGQVFNLLDLYKRGVSNLVNRRHELMTRIAGYESYAKKAGDIAVFYTITAPSKYHKYHSKPCRQNAKWQGATPNDTQTYLNKLWRRARAAFKDAGVYPYGIRVVEPHHDGTPHWHFLFFMAPQEQEAVTQILQRYALTEDGEENGAELHRFKTETINPNKGSAVGYIAKYIAKNIDGEHVEADLYGHDAIESATRIRAWASTWKIRQFQFIGGPSVTVWREARRFATAEEAEETLKHIGSEHLDSIIAACDRGDYQAFIELSGGITTPRKDQSLRAIHVIKEKPNKYGEFINKLLGLCYQGIEVIKTRLREWEVRPVLLSTETNNTDLSAFDFEGANAPPWSSVNKCRFNN